MRLLHYLEIRNFKHFGNRQRIELDHPTVLIGPNNCGKTTAIQSLALWSFAVKTWFEAKGRSVPKERTATSLNRLNIVAVPVQKTRYFWHNAAVRSGNRDIPMELSVGVLVDGIVVPVTMRFRNQGEDLVYCTPDEDTLQNARAIDAAASLSVELLYPMSGLETEEPILQPGRIDVLLGQGQTAQVLRNLCLIVLKSSPDGWRTIARLMQRLFSVEIGDPTETSRGSIELSYRQEGVREPLDISLAGRGFQQMLLLFAYLYSHPGVVLLIDEPDAHLEILRQKQVYVLLREIAHDNGSQVILVTHSEVILEEALDRNLTLLLGGRVNDLAAKRDIQNALKHYGAEHYVRAVQRGYVLYVEGGTDLDILRAFAEQFGHPVAQAWDERINAFYVQNNFPDADVDAELARVEGGFGITPPKHFGALRGLIPHLRGLAILDSDARTRPDRDEGGLRLVYWERYEVENYFVAPATLRAFALAQYDDMPLFVESVRAAIEEVLDRLILERVFRSAERDFETWRTVTPEAARLIWEGNTRQIKLSDFAEEFFRLLGAHLGRPMLARKGELHRLVPFLEEHALPEDVGRKLDLLQRLFLDSLPAVEP